LYLPGRPTSISPRSKLPSPRAPLATFHVDAGSLLLPRFTWSRLQQGLQRFPMRSRHSQRPGTWCATLKQASSADEAPIIIRANSLNSRTPAQGIFTTMNFSYFCINDFLLTKNIESTFL